MAGNDWEALYGALDEATRVWTRDELVALLRDLIREYVVERGLPTGTLAEVAGPDFSRMDFAQMITWLKRNVTHVPELALFQVDGRRVVVDADGPRVLTAGRAPDAAAGRATEGDPRPLAPGRGERPAAGARGAGRAAARPAQPEPPATEASADADEKNASRPLSRGFRGLEFD